MRTSVSSSDAPAAIGPYSQAIRHDGLLWCSGQLGLSPTTGALVGDDTAAQAEQALRNLEAVCLEAGTSLGKALRLTVYLTDLAFRNAVVNLDVNLNLGKTTSEPVLGLNRK